MNIFILSPLENGIYRHLLFRMVSDNLADDLIFPRFSFGFVEFDDYDPVDKILLQKRHNVGGVDIAVKKGGLQRLYVVHKACIVR